MLLDKGSTGYGAFLTRRFFRLFPTYVVCLMAMLPIIGYAVAAISRLPWATNDPVLTWIVSDWAVTKAHLGEQILVHLTMLHGLLPNEVLPDSAAGILGPAWSISLEWQFYLVAPALLWITRRNLWGRCAIFALIILAHLAASRFGGMFEKGRFLTYPLPGFLPLKAEFFFCGACSYYVYEYTRRHGPPAQSGAWALPLLVMVFIFTKSIPLFIWCSVLGCHILRVAGQKTLGSPAVTSVLNLPFFQWAGRISYSTYMCHVPILYGVMLAMLRFKHTWSHLEFLAVLVAVASPAILFCSHILFTWVENPFIVASKRWTPMRRLASKPTRRRADRFFNSRPTPNS